ncbi:hypothetical protein ABZS66_12405 [Dactylosporangium sp. NPDC005572]|uniref:hypothetical protein n=1 Tax=Dactylosporangium sp. NPDC005572 TaxID=3156889 RepID=UPI0033B34FF5
MREHWGHVRQFIHMDMGALPQRDFLRAIELYGTRVLPLVQAELGTTRATELLRLRTHRPAAEEPASL